MREPVLSQTQGIKKLNLHCAKQENKLLAQEMENSKGISSQALWDKGTQALLWDLALFLSCSTLLLTGLTGTLSSWWQDGRQHNPSHSSALSNPCRKWVLLCSRVSTKLPELSSTDHVKSLFCVWDWGDRRLLAQAWIMCPPLSEAHLCKVSYTQT